MGKTFWKSKTFWVNLIALLAYVIFGVDAVPPEMLATILVGINYLLRLITKEPIIWTGKK
jgi:hypothetical protein